MKVQFLGTSASPSMPVLFCHCEVCSIARRIRGKNLRKRSSIIINNDLLVDIGPDIISSSYEYNIPISEVEICLQTHCHYGTDTSVFHNAVWENLEITKKNFDLIILDHTYGVGYESKQEDHLATKDFIGHVQQFIKGNMLKNKGQVYATHISHEGFLEHNEFNNYAKKHDYKIAYDGLLRDLDKFE